MNTSSTINWRLDYPPLMRCEHLVGLYPYTLMTIRKMVQKRSRKVPTPCGARPFVFRRDDVRRHFEGMSITRAA